MARPKRATVRINVRISPEAAELLAQLAPSENKRGEYIEGLLKRAAQEIGLAEAEPEGNGEIAELRRQQAAINARIDALARQRAPQEGVYNDR